MRQVLGLALLGSVMASSAQAEELLRVVYPSAQHETTAEQIFLIGTAPPQGEVTVNSQVIRRSPAGHFAPSFPLKLGANAFTLHYQSQTVTVQVTRTPTAVGPPPGLAFAKDSLMPALNMARLPGEQVCFEAIAPPNAKVSVKLASQTIPLVAQPHVELLPNSAVLTQTNQPPTSAAGRYQGCTVAAKPGKLGKPQFQLQKNGATVQQAGPGSVEILSPTSLAVAQVTAQGVARTGPSTDYSRLTPLPKGTQATVTGREGDWLRLDYGGWINQKETRLLTGAVVPRSLIRGIHSRQLLGQTEVVFPLQVPVPVKVNQTDRTFTLTLYNTTAQTDTIFVDNDSLISRLDWQQVAPNQVQYTFNLKSNQQWGYKLNYRGTSLVLALRHPPAADRNNVARKPEPGTIVYGNNIITGVVIPSTSTTSKKATLPLSGIKILLDPGHGGQELGSRGPTGYPEKDVALIVSKLLRDELAQRGATIYLTREADVDLSLQDRVAMIEKIEPAIALSLHYNALPDNGDALNTQGVAAFWYHAQSHDLAVFLHNYLVEKLNRPSYGVYWNNLALTRPATAPAVLLELGFMINPTEFEWIVNPQEQKKLAITLADGVTEWLKTTRKRS